MLASLPLVALFLLQYSMVTIEAPVSTLGGASTPVQTYSDLESSVGDLVIPQEQQNVTATETRNAKKAMDATKTRKVVKAMDYTTLLNDIGDFRLPSNMTVGHMAKVAK